MTFSYNPTLSCQWISHKATRNRIPVSLLSANHHLTIERFSYDLEMKTREQNRSNKRTEIERFDWFIERIQTRVAFGWLHERTRTY